ncbi:MAG: hypothetical protein WC750_04825 [Patescibacteria group bacterium]|jgi:hypothetical protein
MSEKPNFDENLVSADYVRHSKAGYKTYGKIITSENPTAPFDANSQVMPDLTPEGKDLAIQEAEKYFDKLDPAKDDLFFVSSNEARALETADVYRKVAHARSFEVIKPEKTRSDYSDELSQGEIRVLKTLSIDSKNLVMDFIFNPKAGRKAINWKAVDEETRNKFDQAAAIVEADDRGTFGANYLKYSEQVKQLLPEVISAYDLYQKSFRGMLRLLRWAEKKATQADLHGKNIKILAFGHENALVYPLKEFFGEEGLNNCEVVEFEIDDTAIKGKYRGKEHSF